MSDDPEETRDLVDRYQRPARWAGAVVPPRSAGSPRSDAAFQRSVEEIKRLEAIRGVLLVPTWTWPAFGLLDVFMLLAIYPDASASWVLGIRLLLSPVSVAISLWARRPDVNVRLLDLAYSLMLGAMGVGISLMALEFGGLTSSYMHGVAVVIAAQASRVPEPWTRQLRIIIPTALSFPAVLGVAAIWSPDLKTAWTDPDTLAAFASQYVFVLAVSIVGAVGGHAVWAAREQVYKARRLGAYRLQAPIGEGGMSQVWLAWDDARRRQVALKILHPAVAGNKGSLIRFEREAHATSRLVDPHTVRIYDYGASDDNLYYIAMEYLPGADLQAIVDQHGPLPVARALRLAAQACRSLAEAHAAGIIHRDIKPSNLYVTRSEDDHDYVKVLDFGIARVVHPEDELDLTQTGAPPGTPKYMAPELWKGDSADVASDLYAIGATLYFLLSGVPPFTADAPAAQMRAHLNEPPPPIAERRGAPVPPEVEALVARCLAKAPEQRFRSADALRAAMEAAIEPGDWTPQDAQRFWSVERPRALAEAS